MMSKRSKGLTDLRPKKNTIKESKIIKKIKVRILKILRSLRLMANISKVKSERLEISKGMVSHNQVYLRQTILSLVKSSIKEFNKIQMFKDKIMVSSRDKDTKKTVILTEDTKEKISTITEIHLIRDETMARTTSKRKSL